MNLNNIIDLERTIAKNIFESSDNYWEIIPKIKDYLITLGNSLDKEHYTKISDNIWIGKNVTIDKSSTIIGPCIIDDNTIIGPSAYIRENVIIGKKSIIGNSTEIKNSIIFDFCELPHFNYVGDSIIGCHSHLGAGAIISNLKNDKSNVLIKDNNKIIDTKQQKFGAIIGDNVDIGCNSVIFPGTIVYSNTSIYPLTRVRGIIKESSIVKSEKEIISKDK
ncbi:MAG: UDP-N-acetylglucosamine pyrophosphorylase [Bacilli bacterium]